MLHKPFCFMTIIVLPIYVNISLFKKKNKKYVSINCRFPQTAHNRLLFKVLITKDVSGHSTIKQCLICSRLFFDNCLQFTFYTHSNNRKLIINRIKKQATQNKLKQNYKKANNMHNNYAHSQHSFV